MFYHTLYFSHCHVERNKKKNLNFFLNISLSQWFIELNFRFLHKWPQLNAFPTVHPPSTTPCCNRLQNTEFKKMKVKQNKLCMLFLPSPVVITAIHTEFIFFPSFYVCNFEETNSKIHSKYKKQKKSILSLSFFQNTSCL